MPYTFKVVVGALAVQEELIQFRADLGKKADAMLLSNYMRIFEIVAGEAMWMRHLQIVQCNCSRTIPEQSRP